MSDEWEVFPLRALVDRVVQKNDDGLDLVFSVSAQDGLVDQETYFKKRVASKNLSSYWVVEPGDYVFNKSYSEGFPLGAVVRHTGESPGVVSPLYIVMRPKADSPLVHGWLDFAFESREYAQSLRGLMKEGGRAHGALNVKLDDYFSALIPVPPLPVQRRIVDLMAHLDNHLANLQTERDAAQRLLEVERVELMQHWDQSPLSELCTIEARLVDPRAEQYGRLLHIGIERIEKETGELADLETAEAEGLISSKYLFSEDDVVFAKIRPNLRKVAYPGFSGLCSADAYPLRPV